MEKNPPQTRSRKISSDFQAIVDMSSAKCSDENDRYESILMVSLLLLHALCINFANNNSGLSVEIRMVLRKARGIKYFPLGCPS